jgi:ribosomal protein L11 methyltransferase
LTYTKDITELCFRYPVSRSGAAELLRQVLREAGVPETDIAESSVGSLRFVKVYGLARSQAGKVRKKIRGAGIKGVTIQLNTLRPRDWQERWKKDLHPFKLTNKFDVVPVWRKKEYRPGKRIPILIDTVMAFGTGQHETTRFMVRLIERCEGKFGAFLDVGTGTGILSIIASKCGATAVSAVDIDPPAVEVAQANFRANRGCFQELWVGDIAQLRIRKQYDFVAANLVTARLIPCGKKLVSLVRPGKFLAVSGIALENLKTLKDAYRELPLRCVKLEKGKAWAALLYQRIR